MPLTRHLSLLKADPRWMVLAGVLVMRIAFGFQFQSVAVVTPGLGEGLGISATALGTLVGLYTLPGILIALLGGIIGQWFGEKRVLIVGLGLMILGGIIGGVGETYNVVALGRLLSGVGGVVINVLLMKVVIDWFAGREIATAMSVFLIGFPLGLGLAMLSLGYTATALAWPLAFFVAAGVALLALGIFLLTYRPASRLPDADTADTRRVKLSSREIGMTSLAGLMWALYNGVLFIFLSFISPFLITQGWTAPLVAQVFSIGLLIGISAGPLGGVLADRLQRPSLLVIIGCSVFATSMLLVLVWPQSVPLVTVTWIVGCFTGLLAAAPIAALPAEVLRPETRAQGSGLFYTCFYAGAAVAPPLGGLAADLTGSLVAPIVLTVALLVMVIVLLGCFRLIQQITVNLSADLQDS